MSKLDHDVHFMDAGTFFAADEVVRMTGLTQAEFTLLAELGVVTESGGRYAAQVVSVGRRATRLRDAFELEGSGLALALRLLERIEELEARLHEVSCQLPR